MSERLDALQESVDRLRTVTGALDAEQLRSSAYPTEWTIADVLSHIGSGAVIMRRRLEDTLAGVDTPADAAPAVWDEWNAKSPEQQATDAVVADRSMLDRMLAVTDDERSGFRFAMGPMTFDFDGFVGLRLNEHALHLWDIEVALDPGALVAPAAVAAVVDNLQMFARFTGTPVDVPDQVVVATSGTPRSFLVVLGPDEVSLTAADGDTAPDLELPAEAFVRLVYGRLDPDHTPPVGAPDVLARLRQAFPGS